jgi:hypothetical protein
VLLTIFGNSVRQAKHGHGNVEATPSALHKAGPAVHLELTELKEQPQQATLQGDGLGRFHGLIQAATFGFSAGQVTIQQELPGYSMTSGAIRRS